MSNSLEQLLLTVAVLIARGRKQMAMATLAADVSKHSRVVW
jgi:hypothetical protein